MGSLNEDPCHYWMVVFFLFHPLIPHSFNYWIVWQCYSVVALGFGVSYFTDSWTSVLWVIPSNPQSCFASWQHNLFAPSFHHHSTVSFTSSVFSSSPSHFLCSFTSKQRLIINHQVPRAQCKWAPFSLAIFIHRVIYIWYFHFYLGLGLGLMGLLGHGLHCVFISHFSVVLLLFFSLTFSALLPLSSLYSQLLATPCSVGSIWETEAVPNQDWWLLIWKHWTSIWRTLETTLCTLMDM